MFNQSKQLWLQIAKKRYRTPPQRVHNIPIFFIIIITIIIIIITLLIRFFRGVPTYMTLLMFIWFLSKIYTTLNCMETLVSFGKKQFAEKN